MAGITAVVMGVRAMGPFTGPYIGRVTGRGIGQVTGRGIVRAMVAAADIVRATVAVGIVLATAAAGIGQATVVAADIVPVAAAVAVIAEVTAAAVASGKYSRAPGTAGVPPASRRLEACGPRSGARETAPIALKSLHVVMSLPPRQL
jgi:hypothetical protein